RRDRRRAARRRRRDRPGAVGARRPGGQHGRLPGLSAGARAPGAGPGGALRRHGAAGGGGAAGRVARGGRPGGGRDRGGAGGVEEVRDDVRGRCGEVLARPGWREGVRRAWREEEVPGPRAWSLAPAVGLDLWEEAFARLGGHPTDGWLYGCLSRDDDPERLARLVAFAEEHLPLAGGGAGAGRPPGPGGGLRGPRLPGRPV